MQFKKKSLLILVSCLISSVSYAGKNVLVYKNVNTQEQQADTCTKNSKSSQDKEASICVKNQQQSDSCPQMQQNAIAQNCNQVKNEESESDSLSDSSSSSSSEKKVKTKKPKSHIMSNTIAVSAAGGANFISNVAGAAAQSLQNTVAIYQARKDEESSSESSDSSESKAKKAATFQITQQEVGAQCFTGLLYRKEVRRKNFNGTTFINLEKQNSKHKKNHTHHVRKRKNNLTFRNSHLNNVTFQDTNFKHIRLRHAHINSATFNNVALHPNFLKHAYVTYQGKNLYITAQTSQKIHNHFHGTVAGPITLEQMMQQADIK